MLIYFAVKNGEEIKKRGEKYELPSGEILGSIIDVIIKMDREDQFNNRIEFVTQELRKKFNGTETVSTSGTATTKSKKAKEE